MFIDILVQNFWLSISLWFALMIADNLLSITAVRMYRNGACKHIVLDDGSELNPLFKDDVAQNKLLSPQFMTILCLIYVVAWLIWSYGVYGGRNTQAYEFFIGILLLAQIPTHFRHGRTILLFSHLKESQGVEGRIKYAGWLSRRLQSLECMAFALLFLGGALLMWRVFFLGGALSSGMMALTGWREVPPDLPSEENDEKR